MENPESLEDLKIKERLLLRIVDENQLNVMKEKGISLSNILLSESTTPFTVETRFFKKNTSVYDHCIVIMDEFHNLITKDGVYADKLQYLSNEFANCGDNTILIGMTATPIVESPRDHEEIARIFGRTTLKGCVSYFNDLHPSLYPALKSGISAGGKKKKPSAATEEEKKEDRNISGILGKKETIKLNGSWTFEDQPKLLSNEIKKKIEQNFGDLKMYEHLMIDKMKNQKNTDYLKVRGMKLVVERGKNKPPMVFTSAKATSTNIINMKKTNRGATVKYTLNYAKTNNMTLTYSNKSEEVTDWYIVINEVAIRRKAQLLNGVFSSSEEDLEEPAEEKSKDTLVIGTHQKA